MVSFSGAVGLYNVIAEYFNFVFITIAVGVNKYYIWVDCSVSV